jgi:hypothetical protein
VPHNDYNDPELSFPRLDIRIVKTNDDAFHIQVWKWLGPGQREPRPLVNGKRAGSFADVREFIGEISKDQNIEISPDDVQWPDTE